MRRHAPNELTGSATPWDDDPTQLVSAVHEHLPFDALAVGVLTAQHPQPDELLVVRGIAEADLLAWCGGGYAQDPLFQTAMQTGQATAAPGSNGNPPLAESSLARGAHVQVHMLAATITRTHWWWLLVGRKGGGFSDIERQLAGLMLRYWQVQYDQPDEPGMSRLLIGHDDRLILADVATQARMLQHPQMVRELLDVLHPAVQQRYPQLADQSTRDLAVNVAGHPAWVCFRRARALNQDAAQRLYLELRPLDKDELPPVGTVKDERIAQAIAFIHENFSRSPSLAEVARAVHVSPFHFHRLFTRQVGLSPKHYLQRKQLQVAKWMLRSGGVPIGDIAKKTGFSSHGHFTSTFHRLVGMSPSEYREQY